MPDHYVGDIERLLEQELTVRPAIIIGHSMGGQIAARLAKQRPELVEAVISVDGSLGFHEKLEPVFAKASEDLLG